MLILHTPRKIPTSLLPSDLCPDGFGSRNTWAADPLLAENAVSRVLRKRRIKREQFAFLRKLLMKQAHAIYEDWPRAA
jgi:hypothetical protein